MYISPHKRPSKMKFYILFLLWFAFGVFLFMTEPASEEEFALQH